MKKNISLLGVIFVLTLFAVLLNSCFSPWTGNGNFSISVGDGTGRTALPWGDGSIQIENLEHTITISGGPGPQQQVTVKGSQRVSFSVDPGRWQINVEAYQIADGADPVLVAVGSIDADIKPGNNGVLTIHMKQPPKPKVATPTATPPAGTYAETQHVKLATATDDAIIYYTTDGSDPTTGSDTYIESDGGIVISGPTATGETSKTTILKAIAFKDGMNDSDIMTAVYTIDVSALTVTFNKNGGDTEAVPSSVFVKYNGTLNDAGAITIPTRTGYTLTGWNDRADGTGTTYRTEGPAITDNITLYAVWTANTYTVTFNANGGTGTMANQTFTYGEAAKALSANTFTRVGYTFKGWAESASGPKLYNDGFVTTVTVNVTFYAVWSNGTGTSDDPFLVGDITALKKVGTGTDGWTLDKHYKQTEDINLSGTAWTPIGNYTDFTGSYNGNNKKIIGLSINAAAGSPGNYGLFRIISTGGKVENVILYNVSIDTEDESPSSSTGGIAGTNKGTINKCIVTGYISGRFFVGGIAGVNEGTITNCGSSADVSGTEEVGGVVGDNYSIVEKCYATGNVLGNKKVGGVVGHNRSSLSPVTKVINCYATGNVTGNDSWSENVGGVVGYNGGILQYCYATGDVVSAYGTTSRASNFGGIAGYLSEYGTGGYTKNCVALSKNITALDNAGRVGFPGSGIIDNNYARSDLLSFGNHANSTGSDSSSGEDITASEWKVYTWWTSIGFSTSVWDFSKVGDAYSPILPTLLDIPLIDGYPQSPVIKN